MAKLGSSSCRPLGTLLLSPLLLLALLDSIQPRPVMALELVEQPFVNFAKGTGEVWEKVVPEKWREKAEETGINKALTEARKRNPGWKDAIDGAKKGLKVHKYLCKAQGLMDDKQSGSTPYYSVDIVATSSGLGGDLLPRRLPTFSYYVTSQGRGNSVVLCKFPQLGATLVPSRYPNVNVRITGVLVGQQEVPVAPPAAYTYLDSNLLYGRLVEAVVGQMKALNRGATPLPPTAADNDKLCYAAAGLSSRPPPSFRIALLLASDDNTVQMELGGATDNAAVWYPEPPFKFCLLGIRRTMELLIDPMSP